MKRCPQCNRVETDEALKFCRVDGTTLIGESSGFADETGSAQPGADAGEVHTSILPQNTQANVHRVTGPTTTLPTAYAPPTGTLSKSSLRNLLIAIAIVVVVALVIAGFFISKKFSAARPEHGIESVAVLPFENASGNADSEYLSDGLA